MSGGSLRETTVPLDSSAAPVGQEGGGQITGHREGKIGRLLWFSVAGNVVCMIWIFLELKEHFLGLTFARHATSVKKEA